MIICVCNALRETQCREAAAQPGTRNAGCVYRRLGCRVRCGTCVATMQQIVEHARASATVSEAPSVNMKDLEKV